MEYAIPWVTWAWLFIPMPLLIILSVFTLYLERRK